MKKRGLLVVVSSPSGGGKGTILKELFRRNENLKMSVSATTRAPRPGEEHGVHEKRLRGRGTETEEVIEKRLAAAADEIRCVKDYDYAVINDTVEQAVLDIEAILAAEKLRVSREKDIAERILNHA